MTNEEICKAIYDIFEIGKEATLTNVNDSDEVFREKKGKLLKAMDVIFAIGGQVELEKYFKQ